MRRLLLAAAVSAFAVMITAGSATADLVSRAWAPPVSIGAGLFESDSGLAPLGQIISVQQRQSSTRAARIGVTETDARTGAATDTALWSDPSVGYYPRLATAPTGTAAAAFADGALVYVYVKRPGGSWHEVGKVYEGQTDYSDGRPLLAFTPLGHLVVAWPRKDLGGGQRLWLAELAPSADELTTPRPLDPRADPKVVQVGRDLAVSADGRLALGYLQGPARTRDLTARVAFGRLGGDLKERLELPGTVTPWSWRAPQVGFDLAGGAAIAWHTVPAGFDQGAALGDLHLVLRHPDGTLGAAAHLGQTPTSGALDLGVSDLGEVLLGYDAAGNLSGGGGTWGYSLDGFRGVLGSTTLDRIGMPQTLVPWPGHYPRLAMNRRGDAVLAYTDGCCGRALVGARRRVPGGPFGEPAVVAEGNLSKAPGGDYYYGSWVHEVELDEIGNAIATWTGFGPIAGGLTAAADGPLLDLPLPGIPLGLRLPPIVPPLPVLPPTQPAQPVLTTPGALRRPPVGPGGATGGRRSLALSVRAPRIRGIPQTLRLPVRCDRPCTVQATGRLAGTALHGFRANVPAGRTARVELKLSPAARRRARAGLRSGGSVTARLAVVAASAGGARSERTLRVTLRR